MKLKVNYHTHTKRCGHAVGEDEEYVLNAIKIGIKELGISDHAPFKGISQPGVRMDYSQLDEYVNSINALKEKYKDKIKIYVGFEAEYFCEVDEYYKDLLENKIDYLICGQHFMLMEKEQVYVGIKKDNKSAAIDYVNRVVGAMESGMFKYIAHPDIILRSYTIRDDFIEGQLRRICEASLRTGVPLEINLEGVRAKERMGDVFGENFYPFPSFWKLVGEYGCNVIIGADVHNPEYFLSSYDEYAYQLIEKYHLHLIDKIDIK